MTNMISYQGLVRTFLKPYVKTNKNDAADAEAICEAVTRPRLFFDLAMGRVIQLFWFSIESWLKRDAETFFGVQFCRNRDRMLALSGSYGAMLLLCTALLGAMIQKELHGYASKTITMLDDIMTNSKHNQVKSSKLGAVT
ncbi:hypothetical protein ACV1C9_20165 [Aeromonas caviae]